MQEDRLKKTLSEALEIKAMLPEMWAKDWHYFSAYNEVKFMVTSAEMFFHAAMERKESKDWHLGEDCREMDNKDRLKWIVIQNKNDEMVISTEKVPIKRYPVKPWLPWQMADEPSPTGRFALEGVIS